MQQNSLRISNRNSTIIINSGNDDGGGCGGDHFNGNTIINTTTCTDNNSRSSSCSIEQYLIYEMIKQVLLQQESTHSNVIDSVRNQPNQYCILFYYWIERNYYQ